MEIVYKTKLRECLHSKNHLAEGEWKRDRRERKRREWETEDRREEKEREEGDSHSLGILSVQFCCQF